MYTVEKVTFARPNWRVEWGVFNWQTGTFVKQFKTRSEASMWCLVLNGKQDIN